MKDQKTKIAILTAAVIMGAFLIFSMQTQAAENKDEARPDTQIPQNVAICGKDVSGMTAEEAQEVVEDYLAQYDDVTFTLKAADKSIEASGSDLALSAKNADVVERAMRYGKEGSLIARYKASKDVENGKNKDFLISLTTDMAKVQEFLESQHDKISTDVVDNTVKRENGEFIFVEGSEGISVVGSQSAAAIAEFISSEWDGKDAQIELVTRVDQPRGTKEELSQIKDLLGAFHTGFATSSAGRSKNLDVASGRLNGIVLYPGDELSVYEVCHPFDAENGYALAGAYENGTTVESYGGGICQVSTTLYNAVMRAELEIVTRAAHSMTVSYVDPSMDAAIAGTSKDFRFKNNQESPVYIEGYTSGKVLYFNIYGKETRPAGRKVTFESEITSQTDPVKQFVASGDFPVGYIKTSQSSHTGYTARLWKIVTENGVEVSRDVYNNSTYKVSNEVVTVGVATDNPEAAAAMQNAIATQDEGTIAAAAAQWNAEAVAARAAQAAVVTPPPAITPPTTAAPTTPPTEEKPTDENNGL